MAATSVRTSVLNALITQLKAHANLTGIQVTEGWPGTSIERSCVWTAKVTGKVSFNLMMAGRKQTDDEFTITLVLQAGNDGDSMVDANTRVETFGAAVQDVMANDQTFSNLDGVLFALLDTLDGPDGQFTDEGVVSFMTADIAVHARYF